MLCLFPFFRICECTEAEAEIILQLKSELREKELKLTDIRLEALSSAHHLDQIREAMNRMQVSADAPSRGSLERGTHCSFPSLSYYKTKSHRHPSLELCFVYSVLATCFLIPSGETSGVGGGSAHWPVAHKDHYTCDCVYVTAVCREAATILASSLFHDLPFCWIFVVSVLKSDFQVPFPIFY